MIDLISRFLVPPGGWKFRQGLHELKGDSYDQLVKTVTEHRKNNHIAIGNVEVEIQKQIADENPQLKLSK